MSEITAHCDALMNTACDQVKAAIANCIMHVCADLNVPQDNPAVKVVKDELKSRLMQAVDAT